MTKNTSRRNFLRTVSAATVAGLAASEALLSPSAMAQAAAEKPEAKAYTAETISGMLQKIETTPGTQTLFKVGNVPISLVYEHEVNKISKEFEFHQTRYHIFQIIEGTTKFELGGTPQGAHSNPAHPTEWHAPTSPGSTTTILNKGDMLVIPKGMPHRRSTEGSVTFSMTSFES